MGMKAKTALNSALRVDLQGEVAGVGLLSWTPVDGLLGEKLEAELLKDGD